MLTLTIHIDLPAPGNDALLVVDVPENTDERSVTTLAQSLIHACAQARRVPEIDLTASVEMRTPTGHLTQKRKVGIFD